MEEIKFFNFVFFSTEIRPTVRPGEDWNDRTALLDGRAAAQDGHPDGSAHPHLTGSSTVSNALLR